MTASITWDAFNRARVVQAGDNTTFAYCYDAFGRRIAQWDAEAADTLMGRRYIWDGWSTIQERIFSNYEVETEPESEEWIEMVPTEASAHSKAERVYVNGASIDEPLFVAIDGDLDGYIGDEDPSNFTSVNLPEYEKPEDTIQQVTGRHDFAYYYLNNRMGSITALLARDLEATTPLEIEEDPYPSARILEYYRYSAYGNVTVLPAHDDGAAKSLVDTGGGTGIYHASGDDMGSGSRKAWDRVEDTPLDLSDNNLLMLARREADGDYSHLSARADYGRVSQFGNTFTFTARRQDPHTGLMYYRYRMYEPVTGRFVGRDPAGLGPFEVTFYATTLSNPTRYLDALGRRANDATKQQMKKRAEARRDSYCGYANDSKCGQVWNKCVCEVAGLIASGLDTYDSTMKMVLGGDPTLGNTAGKDYWEWVDCIGECIHKKYKAAQDGGASITGEWKSALAMCDPKNCGDKRTTYVSHWYVWVFGRIEWTTESVEYDLSCCKAMVDAEQSAVTDCEKECGAWDPRWGQLPTGRGWAIVAAISDVIVPAIGMAQVMAIPRVDMSSESARVKHGYTECCEDAGGHFTRDMGKRNR